MVLYVEACRSGSMFSGLASNINVYATTAARDNENSKACYCFLNIATRNDEPTCLGDEYSVAWMEDSDSVTIK